jgi:HEAT repeat protein
MATAEFINALAALVIRYDRGMLEFEDPPPDGVAEGLRRALVAFGARAVPVTHAALDEAWSRGEDGGEQVIDVLADLGSPDSVPYLVEYHRHHANFITSLAAIQALKRLRDDTAYLYLAEMLTRYARDDAHAYQTKSEIFSACSAMGEWRDPRAIEPLTQAYAFATTHGDVDIGKAAWAVLDHYGDTSPEE